MKIMIVFMITLFSSAYAWSNPPPTNYWNCYIQVESKSYWATVEDSFESAQESVMNQCLADHQEGVCRQNLWCEHVEEGYPVKKAGLISWQCDALGFIAGDYDVVVVSGNPMPTQVAAKADALKICRSRNFTSCQIDTCQSQ